MGSTETRAGDAFFVKTVTGDVNLGVETAKQIWRQLVRRCGNRLVEGDTKQRGLIITLVIYLGLGSKIFLQEEETLYIGLMP